MKIEGFKLSSESSKEKESSEVKDIIKGERYLDSIISRANSTRWKTAEIEDARLLYSQTDQKARELTEYEKTLARFLDRYGVKVRVEKVGANLFRVPVEQKHRFLDELPDGYVYIGGAARAVLERTLNITVDSTPRDIDIAHDVIEVDEEERDQISREYMPEDHAYGHGVSPLGESYFEDRDFTRNEVMFDGEYLWCTKDCLIDSVRRIIRLSEHEKNRSDGYINDKLLAKAVRFMSIEEAHTSADEILFKYQNIEPFHMALHLERTLQQGGKDAAQRYLEILRQHGQVPDNINNPEALKAYIDEHLSSPFLYREGPVDVTAEEEFLESIREEYEHLPVFESMGRDSKNA